MNHDQEQNHHYADNAYEQTVVDDKDSLNNTDYFSSPIDVSALTICIKDDTLVVIGENFMSSTNWKRDWGDHTHRMFVLRRSLPSNRGSHDVFSIVTDEDRHSRAVIADLSTAIEARQLLDRIQMACRAAMGLDVPEVKHEFQIAPSKHEISATTVFKAPSTTSDAVRNGVKETAKALALVALLAIGACVVPMAFRIGVHVADRFFSTNGQGAAVPSLRDPVR